MEEPTREAFHPHLGNASQCIANDWRVVRLKVPVLSRILTASIAGVGVFSVAGPIVKSTGSVGLLLVYWLIGPIIALGLCGFILVIARAITDFRVSVAGRV